MFAVPSTSTISKMRSADDRWRHHFQLDLVFWLSPRPSPPQQCQVSHFSQAVSQMAIFPISILLIDYIDTLHSRKVRCRRAYYAFRILLLSVILPKNKASPYEYNITFSQNGQYASRSSFRPHRLNDTHIDINWWARQNRTKSCKYKLIW